jgi:uncharacterized protein related to proFAR isomerase
MFEFTEKVLHELRLLKRQTEDIILGGGVRDMEQYKFLQGRLEGYKFIEEKIASLLKHNPID